MSLIGATDASLVGASRPENHKKFCEMIISLAEPFGDPVHGMMQFALSNGSPRPGGGLETRAYFGSDLETIQGIVQPVLMVINDCLNDRGQFGFADWLLISGFCDDRDFVLACLEWAKVFHNMRRPTGMQQKKNILARNARDAMRKKKVAA